MNEETPSYRKFYRSRKEKIIAGVCGGIAEFFNIDPTWVRVIFILLGIFGGSAVLVYAVMWIFVPINPN